MNLLKIWKKVNHLAHNMKSRDASASKKFYFRQCPNHLSPLMTSFFCSFDKFSPQNSLGLDIALMRRWRGGWYPRIWERFVYSDSSSCFSCFTSYFCDSATTISTLNSNSCGSGMKQAKLDAILFQLKLSKIDQDAGRWNTNHKKSTANLYNNMLQKMAPKSF